MPGVLNYLVPVAAGAVALVLLLGILNLLKQDGGNRSQMLMRWRIGLQFLAVFLIMGALWLRG